MLGPGLESKSGFYGKPGFDILDNICDSGTTVGYLANYLFELRLDRVIREGVLLAAYYLICLRCMLTISDPI